MTRTLSCCKNLTKVTLPDRDTGTTSFTYDTAGNVLTQADARSTVTTYAYDALGRVTAKTQIATANPANKTYTVGYSYANGRQTGLTYPSGHAVTYGFDSGGHVSSVVVDGISILASGTYFPFGAVKAWTWGNGQAYSRTYDLDGRISTITQGPDTATYADLSEVFGYDALNRLVSANLAAGQTQSFAYDFNGNRINATINSASTTYTYPSTSHRLSSLSGATSRSFTYDNAGNTTVSAGIAYTYDGRGRMKQAGTTTYAINGLGQRVKKNNGSDTFFGYDEAGHLIGEYDATGAPIEETIWLGDLPVAVVKPKAPSGFDVFYIWTDNLGTPRQITDATNQSRWEWPSADPFGNNQPNENPGGLGAFNYNLRFPGQYYDAEKASNYNYFRDYDPGIGRYVESDPIGLKGGLNTYGYVGRKPPHIHRSRRTCEQRPVAVSPPQLSYEECAKLRRQIYDKHDKLNTELLKYDPVGDAAGGFPMRWGSGFKSPGGHYNEIKDLQRGISGISRVTTGIVDATRMMAILPSRATWTSWLTRLSLSLWTLVLTHRS